MKKVLFILIAALGLFSAQGHAQTLYGGLGGLFFTAPDFGSEVGIRGIFGVDDIGGRGSQFGVRATVDFYLGSLAFAIGADAYAKFPSGGFDIFAGAGARIVSVGGTAILLQGLVGAEFPITRSFSTFVDFQPGLFIVTGTGSLFFMSFTAGVKTAF